MKQFYTLALAAALSLGVHAQDVKTVIPAPQQSARMLAPNGQMKKITAPAGMFLWGYYNGKDMNENPNLETIGYGEPDEYYIGINVPCNDDLRDNKIKGVVVAVDDNSCMTGDYSVEVYNASMQLLGSQSVKPSTLKNKDFNCIMFDEPVTIDRPVTVCTHFTTVGNSDAACYPAYYDRTNWVSNSFLFGNGYVWADYGSQFGCYAMMLIVGGVDVNEFEATFEQKTDYTLLDTDYNLDFTIDASCGQKVENIEYTIKVDNKPAETRTAEVAIAAGTHQKATLNVPFHSPAEAGDYMVTLEITKINGNGNIANEPSTISTFHNVSRIAKRRSVMEEYTGTLCGWCPRGWVAMKHANEAYPEDFIGIAIHQYNSSDPMYIAYADYPLYFAGAPSCYLDRKGGAIDPYYGSKGFGSDGRIVNDIAEHISIPAAIEVSAVAEYVDGECSQVKVNATLDAIVADTYEPIFVLTADQLTGGDSFKQGNYYYAKYTQADYAFDPDLAAFCEGGDLGEKFVSIIFDDVAIATSYQQAVNIPENVNLSADEKYEVSYILDMPSEISQKNLYDAIVNNGYKVNAIVLAIAGDGTIANACKVPVSLPVGIQSISAETIDAPIYSLDGRRVLSPAQGSITIQNGKKSIK